MLTKDYRVHWGSSSEQVIALPSYSVLIDHADGLYVFDTGFDLATFRDKISPVGAEQSAAQTLPARLALLGLEPADIAYVVNSHYHFDHIGGNRHCAKATTVCHEQELAAALDPHPFEAHALRRVLHPARSGRDDDAVSARRSGARVPADGAAQGIQCAPGSRKKEIEEEIGSIFVAHLTRWNRGT